MRLLVGLVRRVVNKNLAAASYALTPYERMQVGHPEQRTTSFAVSVTKKEHQRAAQTRRDRFRAGWINLVPDACRQAPYPKPETLNPKP